MPEALRLLGRSESVGGSREHETPAGCDARRERERRDDPQQLFDLLPGEAQVERRPNDRLRRVRANESHPIGRGNAGDHAVEIGLHGCNQRCGVGAQRHAVYTNSSSALSTDPAEQPAYVPERLGLGVYGVDEVTGQVAVSAAPADLARPVKRQNRR